MKEEDTYGKGPIEKAIPKFPGMVYEIKGTTGSEISPDVTYIRMPDGSILVVDNPLGSSISDMRSALEKQDVLGAKRELGGFGNFGYLRVLGNGNGGNSVQQKIEIARSIQEVLETHLQLIDGKVPDAIDRLVVNS